jgi:hypothetical protein
MFAVLHCLFAKCGYLFSTMRFASSALCNCNVRAGVQAGSLHLPRAHDGRGMWRHTAPTAPASLV